MPSNVQPIGKRFLIRKSSNAENLPPASSKKAEALVSAREASRRRRARVVSGHLPLKVKKVVQNSQRRASKVLVAKAAKAVTDLTSTRRSMPSARTDITDVDVLPEPIAVPAPALKQAESKVDNLDLPRFLRRPAPAVWPVPFNRENIDACAPGLAGVDFSYIMQGLEVAGPSMWHLVKTAQIDRTSMGRRAALPDEVNVIIADHAVHRTPQDLPPNFPTHVLAVWDLPHAHPVRRKPSNDRQKVSLIPAHNLVLATHCAKWFKLGPTSFTEKRVVDLQGVAGTQINLPVVPLAVPHPESFLLLLQTMYVHKVSWLMDQLVPVQKPVVVFPTPENPTPQNPHYIVETGRRLAARYTPNAIIDMIGMVIGLWQNAVYLGVSDRRLWTGMDWSYDMLLTGLGYSLGRPDLVPRPHPSNIRWATVQTAKA